MGERLIIEARNRSVGIADGMIVPPSGSFDYVLRFPDGDVRPGLINTHDHLHRNHYGRLGAPPYRDAYEWAEDIQVRFASRIAAGRRISRRDALLNGAWKSVFAGVTTVVHHDRWEQDFDADFPVRVARLACADSLAMAPALPGFDPKRPFAMHVAEGCSRRTAREVSRLQARGILGPNLIAVHGVGMHSDDIALFCASGAALVWCPSSNAFLFGRTAPAELLAEGTDVLIGSDSLLTGAGDLLDELRIARATGLVSDARLEGAVGHVAARRLGLATPALQPGAPADLVVLGRPLLEASARDVQLVVVAGKVRLALPAVAPHLGPGRLASRSGILRWVSADATEMNQIPGSTPLEQRVALAGKSGHEA